MTDEDRNEQDETAETPTTDDATGAQEGQNGGRVEFTPAQQGALDRILSDRLARARTQWEREAEEARQAAEAQAEAQRLEEQGQFRELSERQREQIATLTTQLTEATQTVEALTGERDRYRDAVTAHLESRRDGQPEHILALLDQLDPVAQLAWLAQNAETIRRPPGSGIGTPRPKGAAPQPPDKRKDKDKGGFRLPTL